MIKFNYNKLDQEIGSCKLFYNHYFIKKKKTIMKYFLNKRKIKQAAPMVNLENISKKDLSENIENI